jgi:hypothetical protein
MSAELISEEVSIKGKIVNLAAIKTENFSIVISNRSIKIAEIKDETWLEEKVTDPQALLDALKQAGSRADIFTFVQRLPDTVPLFNYYHEPDNVAVVQLSTYDEWWKNTVSTNNRKRVRQSQKKGIEVRQLTFDDEFVKGIMALYNEAPTRQGRRFWHYGKDFDTVKRENSTYLERSEFIGAYLQSVLVGFIKFVYIGNCAVIMQILAKIAERDKFITNALIAKAIEVSCQKGSRYFVYGNFVYGKKGADNLSQFKVHNGFVKVDLPRYFIPLTLKGSIAIKLGFHHYPYNLIPKWLLNLILGVRARLLLKNE